MGKNIIFFIGAGFTKAIVHTAPTGAQFLTKAFDSQGPYIQDTKVTKLKNFVEYCYYKLDGDLYPNIQDVLSLIDYCIQKNEALFFSLN